MVTSWIGSGEPLAGTYSTTGTLLPLSVATDPTMAVAFWPATVADLPKVKGPLISSSLATCEESSPPTSSARPVLEVGNESHLPAYFDDSALVRPMTSWSAASLPFTYPVDPTTLAVMRSVTPLFLTTSVCPPEVVPASPVTVRVAPSCLATEAKCTPLVPTAFRAALYLAVAAAFPALVVVVVLAAPAVLGAAARASAAAAASPAATAAVRAVLWRKGCMTFTLLEARHGGAASADLARDDWRYLPTSPVRVRVVGPFS